MATAPNGTPKKRVQGPRVAKDKKGILLFTGDVDNVEVVFDAWEAMAKRDANPALKAKTFVIEAKKRPVPNQAAPT